MKTPPSYHAEILLQVLIHPRRILRGGVEAGQEHIDHNEDGHLSFFHLHGQIFIVILKLVHRGIIIRICPSPSSFLKEALPARGRKMPFSIIVTAAMLAHDSTTAFYMY